MSVRSAVFEFERGPTCSARMVDGFATFATAGVAWGLLVGSHKSLKEGYKGSPRAIYVAKYVGKSSLLLGCSAGTYFGFNCGIERLRRKRDGINATVAGAVTGAFMAAKTRSGSKIISSSLAIAAVATVTHYIYPVQYSPSPGF